MRSAHLVVVLAMLASAVPSQQRAAVHVAVEQADGGGVEGLTADDFSVRVDGAKVPVERVTYQTGGLSLAIVLDVTASGFWPGARNAAGAVTQTFRDHVLAELPDDSGLRIGSFGRSLRWAGEFTGDRSAQRRQLQTALSLRDAERTGPSPLWDAINEALEALQSRAGRRAVLVVTDGQATGNRLGLGEVADRAIAAGVSINVVFTGASGDIRQTGEMVARVSPERPLIQLAAATGGAYAARAPKTLEKAPVAALRTVSAALRSTYLVEFTAPAKSAFQRLAVTVRDPAHKVRAPIGIKVGGLDQR